MGNSPTKKKSYGLHNAAITGNIKMLQNALKKGASNPTKFDVNKLKKSVNCYKKPQTKTADTALHFAAKYGHAEIVNMLLNVDGIDVSIKNAQGQTALDLSQFSFTGPFLKFRKVKDDHGHSSYPTFRLKVKMTGRKFSSHPIQQRYYANASRTVISDMGFSAWYTICHDTKGDLTQVPEFLHLYQTKKKVEQLLLHHQQNKRQPQPQQNNEQNQETKKSEVNENSNNEQNQETKKSEANENSPTCQNDHKMILSSYAGIGYETGYVCNTCHSSSSTNFTERWWCERCSADYCFKCEPKDQSEVGIIEVGNGRCNATTAKDRMCKNKTKKGKDFCSQHKKYEKGT